MEGGEEGRGQSSAMLQMQRKWHSVEGLGNEELRGVLRPELTVLQLGITKQSTVFTRQLQVMKPQKSSTPSPVLLRQLLGVLVLASAHHVHTHT